MKAALYVSLCCMWASSILHHTLKCHQHPPTLVCFSDYQVAHWCHWKPHFLEAIASLAPTPVSQSVSEWVSGSVIDSFRLEIAFASPSFASLLSSSSATLCELLPQWTHVPSVRSNWNTKESFAKIHLCLFNHKTWHQFVKNTLIKRFLTSRQGKWQKKGSAQHKAEQLWSQSEKRQKITSFVGADQPQPCSKLKLHQQRLWSKKM